MNGTHNGMTVVAIATILLNLPIPSQATPKMRFVCLQKRDVQSSIPTTYIWHSRGKTALIQWQKSFGVYSPQQRCQEVTPRFQKAYDNGSLNYLTNSYINGQPVICAAKEYGGSCQTLIMTLRSDEDGRRLINELKDTLDGRFIGPPKHTNQITIQVDLEEFLRNAPVEKE